MIQHFYSELSITDFPYFKQKISPNSLILFTTDSSCSLVWDAEIQNLTLAKSNGVTGKPTTTMAIPASRQALDSAGSLAGWYNIMGTIGESWLPMTWNPNFNKLVLK